MERDSAERLIATMHARAAADEAVGVLRSWQQCGTAQARRLLRERGVVDSQSAEVARVAALVDADAQPADDPDWD